MADFKKQLADKRTKDALERQLAKVKKAGAPNMNPSWTPRESKKEAEPPPPSLSEFNEIPAVQRLKLARLTEQLASMSKTQRVMAKAKKTIVEDEVKPLCKLYKLDKFMVGENRASYHRVMRATISKDILLACGVSPAVIAKATVAKEIWQFKVTVPGQQSDDEEQGFD